MPAAVISDATNTKLGGMIHGWSIPAGREWSCPGETSICKTRCYAKAGFFRMPSVKTSHSRNYAFSQQPAFTDWMAAEIQASFVRVMRVHVSGDFYDIDYIRKWVEIVRRSPNVRFFSYTRSWQLEEMLPELLKLTAFRNFQLWWSMDLATGPAPLIEGVRRAYMAISDVDAQRAPDDCDLVFRDDTNTVMKKANGVQVCPPENGVTTKVKITCSSCGICWNRRDPQWENDILPLIEATDIDVPEYV